MPPLSILTLQKSICFLVIEKKAFETSNFSFFITNFKPRKNIASKSERPVEFFRVNPMVQVQGSTESTHPQNSVETSKPYIRLLEPGLLPGTRRWRSHWCPFGRTFKSLSLGPKSTPGAIAPQPCRLTKRIMACFDCLWRCFQTLKEFLNGCL